MDNLNIQHKHRQHVITCLILIALALACIGFLHTSHTQAYADSPATSEPSPSPTVEPSALPLRIPVLMYHHFVDQEEFTEDQFDLSSTTVLKKNFIQQMTYLQEQGYTTITVQELLGYIQNQDALPLKPILITSDDGYLSNYTIMYPTLQSMGMKATIFLIGDRIDQADEPPMLWIPKLNWTEAKEMYESQVIDLQSHTYDSHSLINVNGYAAGTFASAYADESQEDYIARIDADIKRSIQGFVDYLGYTPIAFAYPYGQSNTTTEEVLQANGIQLTFSTKSGFFNETSSAYLIKRIAINGYDDLTTFIQKLNNTVRGISLNRTSITLAPTQTSQLTASIVSTDPASNPITWSSSNPSVAKVDDQGKVTAVAVGTATITVTSVENPIKSASVPIIVKVPVTSISVNTTNVTLAPAETSQLIATINPSDATNKAVTWSSSNSNIATVDTSGKVTAVAVGTATITVKSVDNPSKSATVTITVKVPVDSVTVDLTSVTLTPTQSSQLTATINPAIATNKSVTWNSSNTAIATVDATGKVSAVAAGTVTVTVKSVDNPSKLATVTITVKVPVDSISVDLTSVTIAPAQSSQLTATINPTTATNKAVTWVSSSTAIATVDTSGKVKAVAAGVATITVTSADDLTKSATATITVKVPVTSISVNTASVTLAPTQTSPLTATINPTTATNKAVTWVSSNTAIASVDTSGKVTAVATGTATITVTSADDTTKKATVIVTVKVPVTSITVSATSVTLNVNNTTQLTATLNPTTATNKAVTWVSSNTAIATVDTTGKVTAKAVGTATITVTSADDPMKKATATITVKVPVTSVTVNLATVTLNVNQTSQLTATVNPTTATNKAVTWSSSNTAIATVDTTGKVTAKAVGTATITVTSADDTTKKATVTVTVKVPVTSITVNLATVSLNVNQTTQLTATINPTTATNKAVTWSSSNPAIATVDTTGKVTAKAKGTASITVKSVDDPSKIAVTSITVK